MESLSRCARNNSCRPLTQIELPVLQTQFDLQTTKGERPESSLPKGQALFRPYPIDWRFLPEPALLVKDTVRHLVVQSVFAAAQFKSFRPTWAKAAQSRILEPAQRAQRLFIHIPKTGGTSISSCLYERNQPHLTAAFIFDLYGDLARSVPSFAVVRNPLDRLKSAYHFLRNGGTSIIAASRYDMRQLDFTSFADFVDGIHANPNLVNRILTLTPQQDFVCDQPGNVIVDHLFRMTSEGFSQRLIDWLAISQMPQLNAAICSTASVSAATRHKVEMLYAADYNLFESPSIEP